MRDGNSSIDFGEVDSPYGKKSKRRNPGKSDHKHQYENIFLVDGRMKWYLPAGRCTVCGKIGDWNPKQDKASSKVKEQVVLLTLLPEEYRNFSDKFDTYLVSDIFREKYAFEKLH